MKRIGTALASAAIACPLLGVFAVFAHETGLFRTGGPLEKWQTLIAGLIAIFAAFIGAAAIQRQITATDKLDRVRNRRAFAAARAVLPLTLSATCDYAEVCADVLMEVLRNQRGGEAVHINFQLPTIPALSDVILNQFKDAILVSEEPFYEYVAKLIAKIQILHARMVGMRRDAPREDYFFGLTNLAVFIVNAAEIHAISANMFRYARFDTDEIPTVPSRADILNSLRALRVRLETHG